MTIATSRRAAVLPSVPSLWRHLGFAIALVAAAILTAGLAVAENTEITKRRAAERKTFSDAEITEGFFKIMFSAELHGAQIDRIRKYDGPVRVFVDSQARPDRAKQVASAVADIARRVHHLDIAIAAKRTDANVVATLVHDRHLMRTIRAIYGRAHAQRIQRSLDPQCLSSFRKDENFRITRSDVILVTDAGEFIFYDCLYEELLQALGPINDDSTLLWSMFNDDVHLGFFGIYDQYLLNILYHPRIQPGMTREQVQAVLPEVLREVRAWVAEVNDLPQ